jgi:hypothetical protein
MLDSLRKPLFVIAVVLIALAVLVELGSVAVLGKTQADLPRPGIGILYMAVLDGLVLFTIALIGISLIIPERIHGRVQGIVTFVVSLLALIGSILLIIVAVVLLTLMVSLLVAVPFGTIAYFAAFSDFEVGAAAITLSLIMLLKLAFAVFLVLAHQRFLQNKGLVLLILTSLLANIIIAFLHGIVPGFLASITDAIGAIVVAILAAIWALFFFIGSIPSIIKVLRVDRALP